jgi:hypothetical protein
MGGYRVLMDCRIGWVCDQGNGIPAQRRRRLDQGCIVYANRTCRPYGQDPQGNWHRAERGLYHEMRLSRPDCATTAKVLRFLEERLHFGNPGIF